MAAWARALDLAAKAERLAAILVRFELAAASPHFCVAFPPNWPIEIWYGEELTP